MNPVRGRQSGCDIEMPDFGRAERPIAASTQITRQPDGAVGSPDESADFETDGFPETAYLAIAPFPNRYREPPVGALAPPGFDRIEFRDPVVERNARLEALQVCFARRAVHADSVFPDDLTRWMHQRIGQFAVGREQQQPGRRDIEAAYGDPAGAANLGQRVEYEVAEDLERPRAESVRPA